VTGASPESGGRADGSRVGPVCVVDDDGSVRDSLKILLESLGFSVAIYASGSEFLADEQRHQAGCLIIDQHMPEMDGLTTLEALSRDGPCPPTILITGRLDVRITARAAEFGSTAVLEKPFPATRLLELVHGCLVPRR
jgi:FixJ family two-component response regulator